METKDILGLLGGLALFLYGMKMMSDGLLDGAGIKLEYILEKLTNHKLKAILVGTLITCIIQSSSAMTVMLIGFVNAKVMKLNRAIWVIMGANIGTTMTGQLIAFDIGVFAPVFAIVGVILIVFFSRRAARLCGEVLTGIGMLFMGLEMMSQSMIPLQSSELFLNSMITLSHPLFAVLVGALFTAIIQSSSDSIGILQTLAMQHLIPFSQAVYFLFGFDIGTCMTAFIASLSGCRNAKRLALFHLLFNVLGTSAFLVICQFTPIVSIVEGWTPHEPMRQIANMHTLFNVITTAAFLFIDKPILKFIERLIPLTKKREKGYI